MSEFNVATIFMIILAIFFVAVFLTILVAARRERQDHQRGATSNEPPKLVAIEGSKYSEMEDDIPPGIDWDEPIPDNVVYGNFQKPDEPCMQYRMSLRLTAAGVFALVVAWCLGNKELHVVSYYAADGVPLDASLNMQSDAVMDQRATGF